MANPASYLKTFHTEAVDMSISPIRFFSQTKRILVRASCRQDGNMNVLAGKEGKRNRENFVSRYLWSRSRIFSVQVAHKSTVATINGNEPNSVFEVDGLITKEPGVILGMPFGDCPPVILSGLTFRCQAVIALIHGGYESLLAGVVSETIAAMEGVGVNLDTVQALVGPGICGRCYEFGPEAPVRFWRYMEYLKRLPGGKYLVDLPGIIEAQLQALGISKYVSLSSLCTFETPHLFSARREGMRPGDPQNPIKVCMVFAGIKKVA